MKLLYWIDIQLNRYAFGDRQNAESTFVVVCSLAASALVAWVATGLFE